MRRVKSGIIYGIVLQLALLQPQRTLSLLRLTMLEHNSKEMSAIPRSPE